MILEAQVAHPRTPPVVGADAHDQTGHEGVRSLDGELVDENVGGVVLTRRLRDGLGERHVTEAAGREGVRDPERLTSGHVHDRLIVRTGGLPAVLTVDRTWVECVERRMTG